MDRHFVGDLHVKETQEDECGDLAGFSAFSKAPTGRHGIAQAEHGAAARRPGLRDFSHREPHRGDTEQRAGAAPSAPGKSEKFGETDICKPTSSPAQLAVKRKSP
jgi:hypothetical protein